MAGASPFLGVIGATVVVEVMTMTNQVKLEGRVSRAPEEKVLPSGDSVWVVRVVVPRDATAPSSGRPGRPTVDWVDCAVWGRRLRRTVATWGEGDQVAVEGALRRRFYRTPGGAPSSLVEVEAAAVRVIRRAGPA